MFTVGWAPLCTATLDERCLPVVGASILTYRLWTEEPTDGNHDGIVPPRFVAILTSGLVSVQVLGGALAIVGFTAKRPQVAVHPWVERSSAGLGVSGRF